MSYREDLDMARQLLIDLIESAKRAYDNADIEFEDFFFRLLAFYDAERARIDELLTGRPN